MDAATLPGVAISQATKPLDLQGFRGADEGTRTLDLLHGKQTL